jgi:hypothetical protein
MASKGMTAHHFARARLLEPLGRTFMGLEFRHRNSLDLLQQVRLKNYSIAGRGRLNTPKIGDNTASQQFLQVLHAQVTIAEDFVHQSRPNRLARMHWHDRAPTVFMAEKVMAALDPDYAEADIR